MIGGRGRASPRLPPPPIKKIREKEGNRKKRGIRCNFSANKLWIGVGVGQNALASPRPAKKKKRERRKRKKGELKGTEKKGEKKGK